MTSVLVHTNNTEAILLILCFLFCTAFSLLIFFSLNENVCEKNIQYNHTNYQTLE